MGTAFSVYGGKNSVNTQSYGPESRGGACRSEVVVSEGDINYPYVRNADVLIALSQVALDTYIGELKEGGILVFDPDAVTTVPPSGAVSALMRCPRWRSLTKPAISNTRMSRPWGPCMH
ncbi:MAG: 2-oxoacid:acceptor oxidoreductase family protein [Desulfobacterales bacterium]|nr:2-oxoacid:acceptor oxidoreductase family protein [Desulfobacterales bacterium]